MSRLKLLATSAIATTFTASILSTSPSQSNTQVDNITIKKVVAIFRHGDRSPIHPPDGHVLPLSSISEQSTFWSSRLPTKEDCLNWLVFHPISSPTQQRIDAGSRPYGQLTNVGAYQARDLGRYLRSRLIDQHALLPSTLNTTDIHAYSSSIYRSQQTLQNVLFGLYEPSDRKNGKSGQIVINVTTKPDEQEFMYSPDRNKCKHLLTLHKILTHSSNIDPIFTKEEKEVLNKLKKLFHFDQKLATTRVRSDLVCLRSHNQELPKGVTANDIRILESANSKIEYSKYSNKNYFKLALGRLVPRIIDGLNDQNGHKLILFSGHDSTIKPLTVILGLDEMSDWPKYCAHILIEYGENEKQDGYIRVLYNQEIKKVTGCTTDSNGWIKKKDFIQYLSKYGLKDSNHALFCDTFEAP